MSISKIYQAERYLTKYYLVKHLKLLVIQTKKDINLFLNQWSSNLFIRRLEILVLNNCSMNYGSPSLKSLESASYTNLTEITFVVPIFQACKLMSKYSNVVNFLVCIINIYSKCPASFS